MIFSLNPFVPVFLLLIKLVAVDASPISPHLLSSSTKDPDMVVGYIFTVEVRFPLRWLADKLNADHQWRHYAGTC